MNDPSFHIPTVSCSKNPKKKARDAARYARDKVRILARISAWRALNPRKKANAEWYQRNKEEAKAKRAAYYAANKQKVMDRNRRYRKKRPDIIAAQHHRRRVLECNQADSHRIAKWERQWKTRATARCYWCNAKKPTGNCHTDHIEPLFSGGIHVLENLCISCARCNCSKGSRPVSEWNKRLSEPTLL